jgi:hypothetical protein
MKNIVKGLLIAASISMFGCAAESGDDAPSKQQAAPVASSAVGETAQMLSGFEAVAGELELRASTGSLSTDMREIWSQLATERAQPNTQELIGEIRAHATSAELLAFDAEVVDSYVDSFEPVMQKLDQERAAGILDAKLDGLLQNVLDVAQRISESPDPEVRAKTFCCQVTVMPDPWTVTNLCWEWHTAGVWAGIKCAAVGSSYGGSTLSHGSCNWSTCIKQ